MGQFFDAYGKEKVDSKKLGKIYTNQMYLECNNKWLLSRISPICENCSKNNYYSIYKNISAQVGIFAQIESIYKIACPDCNEAIELDREEYYIIEPIVKLNKKLEEGKIDEYQFDRKMEKIKIRNNRKYCK